MLHVAGAPVTAAIDTRITLPAAAELISLTFRRQTFDHRRFLAGNESHPDYAPHMTEDFRIRYAAFKYTVALVLQPKTIVEIGVRGGISALSFLSACPNARFTGIDNGRDAKAYGIDYDTLVRNHFMSLDARAAVLNADSQAMDRFDSCDLCHIDGDHTFAGVRHDIVAAWRGGARWILCDDTNDSANAAGIFTALSVDLNRGSVAWASFPDTWTGNILIRTDNEGQS